MEHTPGPWEVHGLCIKTIYGNIFMDDSQLMPVLLLGSGVNMDANARLIAKAPDLVDALRTLELAAALYMAEPDLHLKRLDVACTAARALLAEIDGEATR